METSAPAEMPATMIRTAAGLEPLPTPPAVRKGRVVAPTVTPHPAYDRFFWLTYVANFFLTSANSVLFRYSDFVDALGGHEVHLGWIVGVGMIGSLTMRVYLGAGIDRYGPRMIWLASLAGFIVSCLAHPWITQHDGFAIYAWRIALQTCLAGFFGASIAYVSARAPVGRLAELIGMLGTSGFLGIQFGTMSSDILAHHAPLESMFYAAALMGTISLVCTWFGSMRAVRPTQHRRTPSWQVIKKYQPGGLLLVPSRWASALRFPRCLCVPSRRRCMSPRSPGSSLCTP
jgi:MFS family permease